MTTFPRLSYTFAATKSNTMKNSESTHAPIKTIDDLFLFAPPENLQKTINELFFSYLIHNRKLFPDDSKS